MSTPTQTQPSDINKIDDSVELQQLLAARQAGITRLDFSKNPFDSPPRPPSKGNPLHTSSPKMADVVIVTDAGSDAPKTQTFTPATMYGSVVNVVKTAVGAGMVTLPFVLSKMGLVLGLV